MLLQVEQTLSRIVQIQSKCSQMNLWSVLANSTCQSVNETANARPVPTATAVRQALPKAHDGPI